MGAEREDEDQYLGSGPTPKLILVGRLDGEIDGRPVSLVAENRDVVFAADNLRTLLTLRRTWRGLLLLRSVFERVGIRVLVRSRWFGLTEVFPSPNYLISVLLPRG